ncbi:MAG TPA: hypothetical protein VI322_01890 [Candidatus Saccharimonadia bacterium]
MLALFACFSPPVMLGTIITEWSLAALVILHYRLTLSRRLIVFMLICLGGFQLAEYSVCGHYGYSLLWSRLGYILITLLPALGIHLVASLSQARTQLVFVPYTLAATFAGLFAVLPNNLNQSVCTGNYIIFQLNPVLGRLWGWYYLAAITTGLLLTANGAASGRAKSRPALFWLAIGYLSFMLPSLIIYWVAPATGLGMPSIMCGFALGLAIVLGFKIAPATPER